MTPQALLAGVMHRRAVRGPQGWQAERTWQSTAPTELLPTACAATARCVTGNAARGAATFMQRDMDGHVPGQRAGIRRRDGKKCRRRHRKCTYQNRPALTVGCIGRKAGSLHPAAVASRVPRRIVAHQLHSNVIAGRLFRHRTTVRGTGQCQRRSTDPTGDPAMHRAGLGAAALLLLAMSFAPINAQQLPPGYGEQPKLPSPRRKLASDHQVVRC